MQLKNMAPEIKSSEIQLKNESEPSIDTNCDILSLGLIRRIMKVNEL